MFHHISKHLKFRQKYSAAYRIFNSPLSVWKYDETLSLVLDILHQSSMLFDKLDDDFTLLITGGLGLLQFKQLQIEEPKFVVVS